jgi:hypothetical protein
MIKPGKIFLVTFLLVIVAIVSTFFSYRERPMVLTAPFTVLQDEILIAPENSLFEAIISNSGIEPLYVSGFGFDTRFCNSVESNFVVNPGENVAVTVECLAGTTAEKIEDATFYVVYSNSESGNYQISSELGASFSFIPQNLEPNNGYFGSSLPYGGVFPGSSSNGGTVTNNGPGEPIPFPPTSPTQPSSGANFGQGNLEDIFFISIGENTNQDNFFINDPTPRVNAIAIGDVYCRWSNEDVSYPNMPSSNQCDLNADSLISCNIDSSLSEGENYLSVSCADTLTGTSGSYHGSNNNLDLHGFVDYNSPQINSVYPVGGTSFPSGTATVVTLINLDERGDCRATVRSTPASNPPLYSGLDVDCSGDGTFTVSCSLNLHAYESAYVYYACRDGVTNFPNVGRTLSLVYYSPPVSSLSGVTPGADGSFAKKSSGGGSKNSDLDSVPDKTPADLGGSSPPPPGDSDV